MTASNTNQEKCDTCEWDAVPFKVYIKQRDAVFEMPGTRASELQACEEGREGNIMYEHAIKHLDLVRAGAEYNHRQQAAYGTKAESERQRKLAAEYKAAMQVLQSAAGMKPCNGKCAKKGA
jgi:hypothetical protein